MRASDRAYERVRDEILTWQLRPGARLSEVDLAQRLGVSRTPLRAALARLVLEGLVDDSRGRTAVVSDVSLAGLTELFELREALEVCAVRLAASRADRGTFVELASRFARAEETLAADGVDAYYDLIARFDAAIDAAVSNAPLRTALGNLRTHLVRARRIAADDASRLRTAADEHRMICEAIAAGDADLAAAATVVHLHGALETMVAKLSAPTPLEAAASR